MHPVRAADVSGVCRGGWRAWMLFVWVSMVGEEALFEGWHMELRQGSCTHWSIPTSRTPCAVLSAPLPASQHSSKACTAATEGARVLYIHAAALPAVTLLSAMHEYYLNTEFVVTILPCETRDLLRDGSPPSGCQSGGVSFSCLAGSRVPSKVRQWTLFLLLISMSNLLSEGPFVLDCSQDE